MKTAPQEAARNAPDGEALFRALEMTPAQATAAEQGEQPGKAQGTSVKRRSRGTGAGAHSGPKTPIRSRTNSGG